MQSYLFRLLLLSTSMCIAQDQELFVAGKAPSVLKPEDLSILFNNKPYTKSDLISDLEFVWQHSNEPELTLTNAQKGAQLYWEAQALIGIFMEPDSNPFSIYEADAPKEFELLKKAVDLGFIPALYILGRAHLEKLTKIVDTDTARVAIRIAANHGYEPAQIFWNEYHNNLPKKSNRSNQHKKSSSSSNTCDLLMHYCPLL